MKGEIVTQQSHHALYHYFLILFMQPYRLDKNTFKHQTLEEASHQLAYWEKKDHSERLRAAHYLNSIAYQFDVDSPPKMDKTAFAIHNRK